MGLQTITQKKPLEIVLMDSNEKPLILVVEDDRSLANWVSDFLIENAFEVTLANRGDEAIKLVKQDSPDLVILDINLPEKNGFTVCQEIRRFYRNPVLMLTARGDESDEVKGLEFGANDYLVKPVRAMALLARINILLGRNTVLSKDHHIQTFGEFKIDIDSRAAWFNGDRLELSTNDFNILWLLVENAGKVISREYILNELRNLEYDGFNRSIDVAVSRIRKKLGDDSSNPTRLKTVWGKGYMFVADAW